VPDLDTDIRAIHRDLNLYPDPESFNPARWLEPSYPTYREPITTYPTLQNFSAFGFGRRICPGLNIAERSLNIVAARIAWACEISSKGDPMEVPLYDYTGGINAQPKWFPFELKARSAEKLELLRQAVEEWRRNDPLG
jgi:cytochrome P450